MLITALGCSGGDNPTGPATGTLEITASTFGLEPDVDGYTIQLDGESPQAISSEGTLRTEGMTGNHSIQLGGIAANCAVSTQNPRAISITPGQTTTVSFTVTCRATTGSLQVTSSTSGPSSDPDGYTITLDGTQRGALGTSGGVNVDRLTPGSYKVGLSGLVANCQVQGNNPRSVTVVAGESVTAAFAVTCATPPASAGALRIVTTTTGLDPDPDGYTFAVDGGASQPIGLNAALTLDNVAASAHSIRLTGIAANCGVQETNPRSASVSAGVTMDVIFTISCAASTGTIQMSVTTSGTPPDPNGYVAKLDGGEPGQPIGVSGAGNFSGVTAGNHSVALTGVAGNCTVGEGVSRNVTVSAGTTTDVAFAVTCTDETGSVTVSVTTIGASPDPDGYTVSIDGEAAQAIEPSGQGTLADLAPGTHSVGLSGLAPNCQIDGENPRPVIVTVGSTAPLAFAVNCPADTSLRWAPMNGSGHDIWGTGPSDIFTVTGYGAAVLHYDGHTWSEQFRPSEGYDLEAVWASTPTDVYAAGNSFGVVNEEYVGYAPIFHNDGTGWTEVTRFLPEQFADRAIFYGLWGASANDVFAVGGHEFENSYRTLIAHYDGISWTRMTSPEENADLVDVWGSSGQDVYAVGLKGYPPVGVVLHYDGTAWTKVLETPQGAVALGVWGSSASDVFVVGPTGSILHYNGTEWSSMPVPTPVSVRFYEIWGTSPTDVFAVGSNELTGMEGVIIHYDGTAWRQQTSGVTPPLYGIWGSSTTDVFVTGNGIALHGTP